MLISVRGARPCGVPVTTRILSNRSRWQLEIEWDARRVRVSHSLAVNLGGL
ncbi:hypothetical protein GCM10028778_15510 [Barrientosiimonas marina]